MNYLYAVYDFYGFDILNPWLGCDFLCSKLICHVIATLLMLKIVNESQVYFLNMMCMFVNFVGKIISYMSFWLMVEF